MQMLRYRPAAPLSAFIDQFWYALGCDPDRKRQSALPTGSVDLTFNLAADDLQVFANAADHVGMIFDGAVVHGAQSKYFVLDARRDVHVIGVHFHPGGGAALLGVNAQELTDRHVALSDIWGERAHTLRAQLLEAPTPAAKFALLEQEFTCQRDCARGRSCILLSASPYAACRLHRPNCASRSCRLRRVTARVASPRFSPMPSA